MSAIVVPHEGVNWVVGGDWTAGGRFPARPRKVADIAREEGRALKGLGFVHFPESQQGAWFEFDDGKIPRKARPLAAQVAGVVLQTQWPWRGVFRLSEDVYWLIVIDQTGGVAATWDIAGSQEHIMEAMNARIAQIATIPNVQSFNSVEESWAFLMSMGVQAPLILPATGGFSAKNVLRVLIPVAVVGAGAFGGLALWKRHMAQEVIRQQLIASRLRAEASAHMTAQQAARLQAQVNAVRAFWASYPKPWVSYVSWGDVLSACQVGPLHDHGWVVGHVQCQLNKAGALSIEKAWKRQPFANVLDAPNGSVSPDWNAITWMQTLPAQQYARSPATGGVLLPAQALRRYWAGMTQKYGQSFNVEQAQAQPFRPPYPPNTPPNVQKAAGSAPILWYEIPVTISTSLMPAAASELLNTPDFVPEGVFVKFARNMSETFTLKGIQYAQP